MGRYWSVRVADGPITARYRFIKNAKWGDQINFTDASIHLYPVAVQSANTIVLRLVYWLPNLISETLQNTCKSNIITEVKQVRRPWQTPKTPTGRSKGKPLDESRRTRKYKLSSLGKATIAKHRPSKASQEERWGTNNDKLERQTAIYGKQAKRNDTEERPWKGQQKHNITHQPSNLHATQQRKTSDCPRPDCLIKPIVMSKYNLQYQDLFQLKCDALFRMPELKKIIIRCFHTMYEISLSPVFYRIIIIIIIIRLNRFSIRVSLLLLVLLWYM